MQQHVSCGSFGQFLTSTTQVLFCSRTAYSGLAFTCKALQNMQNDRSVELHICFKRSYDEILRHHHSFVVRSLVAVSFSLSNTLSAHPHTFIQVAIRAVPRRQDFYTRLAQGGSVDEFDVELTKWLQALEVLVKHLREFLEGGGHGRVI